MYSLTKEDLFIFWDLNKEDYFISSYIIVLEIPWKIFLPQIYNLFFLMIFFNSHFYLYSFSYLNFLLSFGISSSELED